MDIATALNLAKAASRKEENRREDERILKTPEYELNVEAWVNVMMGLGAYIPLNEFEELPLPYINKMVAQIVKNKQEQKKAAEEEEEARKRKNRYGRIK